MKNELKINEVSAYLGYKLNLIQKNDWHKEDWSDYRLVILNQVCESQSGDWFYIGGVTEEGGHTNYENNQFKPVLHPLSDLAKMIEFGGESFVPNKWMLENSGLFNISKTDMEILIKMFMHVFTSPLSAPYYFINKLLEWHFDVFGLIERGLAVDINSIKLLKKQNKKLWNK